MSAVEWRQYKTYLDVTDEAGQTDEELIVNAKHLKDDDNRQNDERTQRVSDVTTIERTRTILVLLVCCCN
jgi:hypothetical protein